jgi:HPt (histidine-containing phosphotransfer) domain-containing protein
MANELTAGEQAGAAWRKATSRPVDLVHLSRYTLGDRTLEHEVLKLFCTQSFICLDQLREAKSGKDWQEAAHSLKGSARAIGAWRVAQCAERAESIQEGDLAQLSSQYTCEIETALREALAYIESLLTDTEAAVR